MTEQTQRKWTQDEEGNLTCLDCGLVVQICEKYDAPFWRWAQCECWATNFFSSASEAIAAWKTVKFSTNGRLARANMDFVNKPMTPAEKARRMEDAAEHRFSYNMSNRDADIAAEAAAHFRALIPDANGLLPCPMCGADGRPEIFEEIHKGMAWHRGRCVTCGLATAKKWMRTNAIAVWNRRGGVAYE